MHKTLREELKHLEEETKQRFTVQTQVNHALTHLALSVEEWAEFLKDLGSLSVNRTRRACSERGSLDPV